MPDRLKALLDRSSVGPRRMTGPAPPRDELLLVASAAAAPDHASLGPFRLIHITDDTRAHLADIFAAALEADPDADAEALAKPNTTLTQFGRIGGGILILRHRAHPLSILLSGKPGAVQ